MKMNKKIPFAIVVLVFILAISTNASAQRRHYDRGNHYGNNYAYNYYRPSRSYVSVNIGRPYSYRPYYSSPVVYRSARPYVHFGPSFGVRINILPRGYYPFYIGPNPYYYYDGIYYRSYTGGGYEVVAPPLGATVKHLPSGTKVTVIDGVKYYELGGTYYQEEISDKNKLSYKVVGTDGVLNTGAPDATVPANDNTAPAPAPKPAVEPAQNKPVLPEVGARFDQLPEGSKTVIIKKEKYYLSPAGVYYQEVIDGNNIRYEVTGTSDTDK